MTPKEKAEQLVEKYAIWFWNRAVCEEILHYILAKQCALIAVNEIINSNPHSNPLNTEVYPTMDWWQEVKQELEKL